MYCYFSLLHWVIWAVIIGMVMLANKHNVWKWLQVMYHGETVAASKRLHQSNCADSKVPDHRLRATVHC